MKRIIIQIDEDLLARLDAQAKVFGFGSRAEFIRYTIRSAVNLVTYSTTTNTAVVAP